MNFKLESKDNLALKNGGIGAEIIFIKNKIGFSNDR